MEEKSTKSIEFEKDEQNTGLTPARAAFWVREVKRKQVFK